MAGGVRFYGDGRKVLRLNFNTSKPQLVELIEDGVSTTPTISMNETEVNIGCTTVERSVVEKLAELFKEHFPEGWGRRVKIQ
jgi:hypothetical protein